MKEWMIRIGKFAFSEKIVAIAAAAAFLLLLYPLARLAHYAVPWYDDYGYGGYVKSFLAQEQSLSSVWQGIMYSVKTTWWAWQGTFSSVFMMSLMPAAFGEQYYEIGILYILGVFLAGCLLLTKTMAKYLLKAKWSLQLILAVLVTTTLVELMYTAQQGLYWYNAAVHYTFMHGCMFLLTAAIIKVLFAKNIPAVVVYMLLSMFLSLVCGGSNYVSCLQGMIILVSVIGLGILAKNKKTFFLLAPAVVYAIALYYNMIAPGNQKRGAYFQGYGPVKSILYSFRSAAMDLWKFSGPMTILLLLLAVPFLWNGVRKLEYRFRLPGLVSLYSFCVYASGFTSSYYAMGGEPISRTLVVVKYTFQMLLFINEAYWLGWLAQKLKKKGKEAGVLKYYWGYFAAFAAGVMICFCLEPNQVGSYSSYGAFFYLRTAQAGQHYQEYMERIETINNGGANVGVKPYTVQPWFTTVGELSADPNSEPNQFMATFYGKDSIYLLQE